MQSKIQKKLPEIQSTNASALDHLGLSPKTLMVFLEKPLSTLKGIGPYYASRLKQLKLHYIHDLLRYFPTDRHVFCLHPQADEKNRLVPFKPHSLSVSRKVCLLKGKHLFSGESVHLLFQAKQKAYLSGWIAKEGLWHVWGTIYQKNQWEKPSKDCPNQPLQFFHPKIAPLDAKQSEKIEMHYPSCQGISQTFWAKRISQCINLMPLSAETKPTSTYAMKELLRVIHGLKKSTQKEWEKACQTWRQLALTSHLMLIKKTKMQRQSETAQVFSCTLGTLKKKLAQAHLSLTPSQESCLKEMIHDMSRPFPMRRLLQGDVGSGKTLVALSALWLILQTSNLQGVNALFLAPTMLLAEQVYHVWRTIFSDSPAALLLTRETSHKAATEKLLKHNPPLLIIDTHALLAEKREWPFLKILIIDEQQRFGVLQRLKLTSPKQSENKSCVEPHTLFMTATPIPRTQHLCLTQDLDVSYLSVRHPSKRKTLLMSCAQEADLLRAIETHLATQKKVFWVCPAIDSETEKATIDKRIKALPPSLTAKTAVLHGGMKATEQKNILSDFISGKTPLLITTTVIETGIDVPDADFMVIEDAPCFGLSQLHQLRGRVGRQGQLAYVIALYRSPLSAQGQKRLSTFKKYSDGFDIAKKDLEIRGGGTPFGLSQSGLETLWELLTPEEIDHAQEKAEELWPQLHQKKYCLSLHSLLFLGHSQESCLLSAG